MRPSVVVVLFGAVAIGSAWLQVQAVDGASDPLRFTVTPSKSEYRLGEQIQLRLRLTLGSRARESVTVSAFPHGTVHVARLLRNGRRVSPVRTVADFEEDPRLLQVEALRSLRPGRAVAIPFDVEVDGSDGAALSDIRLRPDQQDVALVYRLRGRGTYAIQLSYRYTGRAGGKKRVVRRRVVSNRATFRVR